MANGQLSLAVAIGFVFCALAVGIFDIVALLSHGRIQTVTTHVMEWSQQYPLLPFSIGVIIGHLFFPSK